MRKADVVASYNEVRLMIETILLNIIYILFYALIEMTIIAVALIIAIVIVLGKSK